VTRKRIFDHLDGAPWDALLSRAAWAMVRDRRWLDVPRRDEPAAVSGEFTAKAAQP
jgi:hypothetical protein